MEMCREMESGSAMKLKDRQVGSLPPGLHNDQPNLYLDVQPSGSRSWIFKYQLKSRRREMGLGSYPSVSLLDARKRAAELRVMVKRDKLDPLDQQEKEASGGKTFQQWADQFLEHMEREWKPNTFRHAFQCLRDHINPHIGSKPIDTVASADVIAIVDRLWADNRPTARRCRVHVHSVMEYAKGRGAKIDGEPASAAVIRAAFPQNAKQKQQPTKPGERDRKRRLPYKKAPAFAAFLRDQEQTPTVRCMTFALLTVARTMEAAAAPWSEFDLGANVWVVPPERMPKGAREHRVPLNSVTRALMGQREGDATYVFSRTGGETSLSSNTMKAWLEARDQWYKLTTVHGLRKPFSEWAHNHTRYSYNAVELSMSHNIGDSTAKAYTEFEMIDERRQMMMDWATFLGWTDVQP